MAAKHTVRTWIMLVAEQKILFCVGPHVKKKKGEEEEEKILCEHFTFNYFALILEIRPSYFDLYYLLQGSLLLKP